MQFWERLRYVVIFVLSTTEYSSNQKTPTLAKCSSCSQLSKQTSFLSRIPPPTTQLPGKDWYKSPRILFQIKSRFDGKVVESFHVNNFLRLVDTNQFMENHPQRAFYFENVSGMFRHNLTNFCITSHCMKLKDNRELIDLRDCGTYVDKQWNFTDNRLLLDKNKERRCIYHFYPKADHYGSEVLESPCFQNAPTSYWDLIPHEI